MPVNDALESQIIFFHIEPKALLWSSLLVADKLQSTQYHMMEALLIPEVMYMLDGHFHVIFIELIHYLGKTFSLVHKNEPSIEICLKI